MYNGRNGQEVKDKADSQTVFSPQQLSTRAMRQLQKRRETGDMGIVSGIPDLDNLFGPLIPGELIGVLGNTSNYKTGLMMHYARQAQAQILARKLDDKEIVVYCTWEQTIEEHTMVEFAHMSGVDSFKMSKGQITDDEWDKVLGAAARYAEGNMWMMGRSIASRGMDILMDIDNLFRELARVEKDYGVKPGLIVIDYLQLIDVGGGNSDLRMAYIDAIRKIKSMSISLVCPIMLGSQANKEVVKQKWAMPGPGDSMETAAFGHACDKLLSVWMPKTTMAEGEKLESKKYPGVTVNDNLLVIGLGKQRFGPASKMVMVNVYPATNTITPLFSGPRPIHL